jgi:ATP-dependent Clp protease ATP-binding subunit ClpC
MQLLDRFSSHLKDILAKSIHLATELKNPAVEPVHLFFATAHETGSVATEIMNRFKISEKMIEQAVLTLPTKKEGFLTTSTDQQTLTPLSPGAKAVLEKAMSIAEQNSHNYIGSEHLLSALLSLGDSTVQSVLTTAKVHAGELQKQLDVVLANATHLPHLTEVADNTHKVDELLEEGADPLEIDPMPKKNKKKESALEFFAVNLTKKAEQKQIDPVIGRDTEIERAIQVLSRRTKNNPLLLGEPGVGKTAIVEGLAKRIIEGDVPEMLRNKKIYALDMGMLIAGTIYRGEFEARLRQVIEEATNNPSVILFIDELHNIVGAGANQGAMDAANILKPALARGQLRCIGATTPPEFKKYIENDPALERRFQPITVKEPSAEDTVAILSGIAPHYEAFHKITITPEAIQAAVTLSLRYITNKFLPDKAIDLIDETAAARRLTIKTPVGETKLAKLEQKLEKIIIAKESAAQNDAFDQAVTLKKEESRLRAEIKKVTEGLKTKKVTMLGSINARDVAEQVAKIIGTKPSELIIDDTAPLLSLETKIKEHIVGQDAVIKAVADHIRQAQLGLSNPNRPLASFLFVGESGVGKTELAKTLAQVLYNHSDALIKLDMSEFNESFGVSKLLGSPAGYIGYKEHNQFTDKIKMNPYSVLLFDEIDKAHRDVMKLLLQILENGEITDATGRKISLRHTIIILTTSYGADDVKRGTIGFSGGVSPTLVGNHILLERLKEFFTPEVINRLDAVCAFEPLGADKLRSIAALELERFNERLVRYKTKLTSNDAVLEWLIAELPTAQKGARDVRRIFRSRVEQLMSETIIRKKIKPRYSLVVEREHLALK